MEKSEEQMGSWEVEVLDEYTSFQEFFSEKGKRNQLIGLRIKGKYILKVKRCRTCLYADKIFKVMKSQVYSYCLGKQNTTFIVNKQKENGEEFSSSVAPSTLTSIHLDMISIQRIIRGGEDRTFSSTHLSSAWLHNEHENSCRLILVINGLSRKKFSSSTMFSVISWIMVH